MKTIQTLTTCAIAVFVAGAIGCSKTAEQPPAVAAPAPAAPPPIAPPPPTLAAQHEMALTDMGGKISDDGLRVMLESADFASGKSDFTPSNTDRIDHVAGLLKERAEFRLIINGYTDSRGRAADNLKLSKDRAESVKQYLVQNRHIDADRIEANGKGDADPVASNDTEEGRAQNRRVELRIVDADGKYTSRAALGPGAP